MADTLRQYYHLAEVLNDDIHTISYLVQKYHPKRIYFSAILADIENASIDRLEKFADTIDLLSSMGAEQLRAEAEGIVFNNEQEYMKYLQDLLQLNNVTYVSYSHVRLKSKGDVKPVRKFEQGVLF